MPLADLPPVAAEVKSTSDRFKLKAGRTAVVLLFTGLPSVTEEPSSHSINAALQLSKPGERSHHQSASPTPYILLPNFPPSAA